jgi:hypothetical protein
MPGNAAAELLDRLYSLILSVIGAQRAGRH